MKINKDCFGNLAQTITVLSIVSIGSALGWLLYLAGGLVFHVFIIITPYEHWSFAPVIITCFIALTSILVNADLKSFRVC